VVNDTGALQSQNEYDGYGITYPEISGPQSDFRFVGAKGYVTDDDTGLDMLGHRFYIPQLGRFLNQDPIGQAGGLNIYAYAGDNPVNDSDPSGLTLYRPRYQQPTLWDLAGEELSRFGRWLIDPLHEGHRHLSDSPHSPFSFGPASGGIEPTSSRSAPDDYSRPSNFRSGVRQRVWDAAKDENGDVYDPLTGKKMDPNEPWDMGHKPGYEFSKHVESAQRRGISRDEFLDEYNNPDHYRPELPSSNRGHAGEAPSNVNHWP
jgi:RHS repeat-associated protein